MGSAVASCPLSVHTDTRSSSSCSSLQATITSSSHGSNHSPGRASACSTSCRSKPLSYAYICSSSQGPFSGSSGTGPRSYQGGPHSISSSGSTHSSATQ